MVILSNLYRSLSFRATLLSHSQSPYSPPSQRVHQAPLQYRLPGLFEAR